MAPALFRARSSPLALLVVMAPLAPAARAVAPLPDIDPPDQASVPVTVTVSLPVKVPLDSVRDAVLMALPLLKFSVPPATASGPTAWTLLPLLKVAVPPLAVVPPLTA